MEEGNILKWLKAEGDRVQKEELLFEMETDKVVLEVPSPAEGVLLRVMVPEGLAKVEQVVGWIGQAGETPPADEHTPHVVTATEHPASRGRDLPPPPRAHATPAARRRAAELGVELSVVLGTGPGGRITQEDVERVQSQLGSASQRKALSRHLTTSWQSIPHIHISRELEAGRLADARQSHTGVSVTDLLLYVLSRLLPEFGQLTQVWRDENLVPAAEIHLAFAVDTPQGVVAPVIRSAAHLSLGAISQRRRELSEAVRERRLKPEEIEGAVFTLTNLGMHEVDFFAPIIPAPQTAILATGRLRQQPVVEHGDLRVGWRMWANLAVDHRVTDGAYAARFLTHLQGRLNRLPEEILAR